MITDLLSNDVVITWKSNRTKERAVQKGVKCLGKYPWGKVKPVSK